MCFSLAYLVFKLNSLSYFDFCAELNHVDLIPFFFWWVPSQCGGNGGGTGGGGRGGGDVCVYNLHTCVYVYTFLQKPE